MSAFTFRTSSLTVVTLVLVVASAWVLRTAATPLDDYVNKKDGAFNYTDLGVVLRGTGWRAHVYNMTSQFWLSPADSNRHLWWHYVAIIIPNNVNYTRTQATLYITGNDNEVSQAPTNKSEDLNLAAQLAMSTSTATAVLWQVPNQPIYFPCDPLHLRRTEDAAIALTWWHFMRNTSEPDWILELPMTKSGVKALDMMHLVLPQYLRGARINEFIVAGASKRGWTTWLVGAVDKRVKAIIPIVLDALKFVDFAHRQFRMYGAWSFALSDYYRMNFTQDLDLPQTKKLAAIIDPYFYLHRLTMPKLTINAGGDEFQMPDDQRHWGHAAPGEMNYLMVKNADHSLATNIGEVLQSAGAFIASVVNHGVRPVIHWEIDPEGNITVSTDAPPTVVTIAYADSAGGISEGRRDFRWAAINATPCPWKVFGACVRPVLWTTTSNVEQLNSTSWRAHFPAPSTGWRSFFIEMQFANPFGEDFYFTSPASVVPPTYPFPDCHGAECKSYLV